MTHDNKLLTHDPDRDEALVCHFETGVNLHVSDKSTDLKTVINLYVT